MTPQFLPGAKLCGRFYWNCVRPMLDRRFPGVPHAAALIDSGSEVLGFDDAMSTDHHWGPRVLLFLHPPVEAEWARAIHDTLARELPYEFEGYPTSFTPPDPNDNGTQLLEQRRQGPVAHRVTCQTVAGFIAGHLNFDIDRPIEPADWLTFSEQRLGTLAYGPVFHDAIGLEKVRARFNYYPHEVWLYLLAAGWNRIGQEEHLMGRAGWAGDEIGSALIGARLVRDIMRLSFLMERRYAPYPKWLGSGFQRLGVAEALLPSLEGALRATDWQARETHLVRAYETLAARHNVLGLTEPMPERATPFFNRPFQSIGNHGFARALLRQIRDARVQALARLPLIGSLDQFSDNTDLVADPFWRRRVRQLYTEQTDPNV
jgi:hypothetical protein